MLTRSTRWLNTQTDGLCRFFQSDSSDFVRRIRHYEKLKSDDQAIADAFQSQSQFVLFLNHQPLLTVTPTAQSQQSGMEFKMKRIPFQGIFGSSRLSTEVS